MSIVTSIEDNRSRTAPPQVATAEGFRVVVSASDVREFVQYLRLKPAGVVAAEELDRSKKRLFDERKLAAYESLGITKNDAGVLTLSAKGWRYATNFEFDAQAFRSMLSQSMSCWSALQWMSDQDRDMITSPEVIGFWVTSDRAAFTSLEDEQLKGCVVSFFSFCQGAGLGTMTLGKRGHITRFSVDRLELKRFLDGAESVPERSFTEGIIASRGGACESKFKVVIHCCHVEISRMLQDTLDLVELNNEKIELRWDDVVSQRSLCEDDECALLVVIGDDCFNGAPNRSVDERVLLGLGAAHILFSGRVIVLAEKKDMLFDKLSNLRCFEFDGSHLSWRTGLEIVRALNEMKETLR
jgi:hypothetical protein